MVSLSVPRAVLFIALFMGFTLSQMALAGDANGIRPHFTLNLGSSHINATRSFREINPGIGLGFTRGIGQSKTEIGLEGGPRVVDRDREVLIDRLAGDAQPDAPFPGLYGDLVRLRRAVVRLIIEMFDQSSSSSKFIFVFVVALLVHQLKSPENGML